MKKELKKDVLKIAKHIAVNENAKAVEGWPPCTSILYQPKRKK